MSHNLTLTLGFDLCPKILVMHLPNVKRSGGSTPLVLVCVDHTIIACSSRAQFKRVIVDHVFGLGNFINVEGKY